MKKEKQCKATHWFTVPVQWRAVAAAVLPVFMMTSNPQICLSGILSSGEESHAPANVRYQLPTLSRSPEKPEAQPMGQGNRMSHDGPVQGPNPDRTRCNDVKVLSGAGCQLCNQGMPGYDVHAAVVSLSISDTPLTYEPPIGPVIAFTLFYSQREANQPSFGYWNVGPKWTTAWYSTITDEGYFNGQYHPGADNPKIYLQGGGMEYYSTRAIIPGQSPPRYQYGPAPEGHALLVQNSDSGDSYHRYLPDGTVQEFDVSTPVATSPGIPHTLFLSREVDPQGHAITFEYDGQYRLIHIIDSVSQETTLAYGDPADPARLTSVTDPFGRVAVVHYNAQGQVDSITDVMKQQSTFS
jgi:YD repeat-containing protein